MILQILRKRVSHKKAAGNVPAAFRISNFIRGYLFFPALFRYFQIKL